MVILLRPGIFNWALQGCLDWQRDGIATPSAVRAASAEYRSDMDVIGQFVADECDTSPALSAPVKALYARFRAWCDDNGFMTPTVNTFSRRLIDQGFEKSRNMEAKLIVGVSLKT